MRAIWLLLLCPLMSIGQTILPTAADVRLFNFKPQSLSASLSAGVQATVTLRPCPPGVNGSDAGHYLRISGGTAESVLITGGTCTSGKQSGTIIFTPANSHSGASVSSATAGIQEAIVAAAASIGSVIMPAGNYLMYATAAIPGNVTVSGVGPASCLLPQSNGLTMLSVKNATAGKSSVSNLCMDGTALALGGANTIKGIYVAPGSSKVLVESLWIKNIRYGVFQDGSTGNTVDLTVRDVFAHEFTGGYFGNQITGEPGNLVYNTLVDGWHYHADTISPPIALEFSGCISCMVHQYVSNDQLTNIGIQLTGHNEGFTMTDSVVTHPSAGIWLKANAGVTAQWSMIGPGVLVDQATTACFKTDSGGLFTTVQGSMCTNLASGGIGANIPDTGSYLTYGMRIQNNVFQGMNGTAIGVNAEDYSQQFNITGNFINGGGSSKGIVLGTNATSWIAEGNVIETPTTMVDNSVVTGNPKVLGSNIGVGLAYGYGPAVTAASTIAPVYRAFDVVGTTAIVTITVPSPTPAGTSIQILPRNAFTWTGAGNIGLAGTAVIGKIITFLWDGTYWWPSY
jgi:hypothetical protein